MATGIILALLVIICVLGVKSYAKKLKNGCCGGGDSVRKIKPIDKDKNDYPYKVTVHIDGMHCSNCSTRVENAFNKIDGYYAKVNLGKKSAEILTKNIPDEDEMRDIISRTGYVVRDLAFDKQ